MSDWISVRKELPKDLAAFDVTINDGYARLLNLALWWPQKNEWELLVDKHNYSDCKVVAWRERPKAYDGDL